MNCAPAVPTVCDGDTPDTDHTCMSESPIVDAAVTDVIDDV